MNVKPASHARQVRGLFGRIAARYDLMNRLMTGAQDVRWRREVLRRAQIQPGERVLDLGAGTGDLAFGVRQIQPSAVPVAADFSLEMMRIGQRRGALDWSAADALQLPFAADSFDVVVSGFLLRNVTDVQRVLREQYRVLKPGGRLVLLDTTPPRRNWLRPLVRFYMHSVVPALGAVLTGSAKDYRYLAVSTQQFLSAEELAVLMALAGFEKIGFRRLMLDTIAIHWAEK